MSNGDIAFGFDWQEIIGISTFWTPDSNSQILIPGFWSPDSHPWILIFSRYYLWILSLDLHPQILTPGFLPQDYHT